MSRSREDGDGATEQKLITTTTSEEGGGTKTIQIAPRKTKPKISLVCVRHGVACGLCILFGEEKCRELTSTAAIKEPIVDKSIVSQIFDSAESSDTLAARLAATESDLRHAYSGKEQSYFQSLLDVRDNDLRCMLRTITEEGRRTLWEFLEAETNSRVFCVAEANAALSAAFAQSDVAREALAAVQRRPPNKNPTSRASRSLKLAAGVTLLEKAAHDCKASARAVWAAHSALLITRDAAPLIEFGSPELPLPLADVD